MITISWQTLTAIAAGLSAIGVISATVAGIVRFFDRQKAQDTDLVSLREKHEEDIAALRAEAVEHHKAMMAEQKILTQGVLACLEGLSEKGCNGPVTKAIGLIKTHLNEEAHR